MAWEAPTPPTYLGKLCQGFHGNCSSGVTFWFTARVVCPWWILWSRSSVKQCHCFLEAWLWPWDNYAPDLKTGREVFSGELQLTASQWKEMLCTAWNSNSTNKFESDFRSGVNRWYQIQVAKITITSLHFSFCLCVCECVLQPQRNRLWLKMWN